ncbi:3-oxoacyl-[acyl-carrier-protein] synthase-1 [Undibacterium sp. GrIS 1.2]|uniref:hypothetical protein n=1 Tax=Undibacterium sp. GrIS 1.2 TaxID=3143933 RepID=UPI003396F2DF
MTLPIAILRTGAVTSVGLNAPSTFAAMRARLNNFEETAFLDSKGEPVSAGMVVLDVDDAHLGPLDKQVVMLAQAVRECLQGLPELDISKIPLLLCVAEVTRPGRPANLEQSLSAGLGQALQCQFSAQSATYAYGQSSGIFALNAAFELLKTHPLILIAGVDSYLNIATLKAMHEKNRIFASDNQIGFIPGEAACAILVGHPDSIQHILPRYSNVQTEAQSSQTPGTSLFCTGLGIARETAVIGGTAPNKAKGLSDATKAALNALPGKASDIGLRISGQSSEDFYAKEFAIANSRSNVSATSLWTLADSLGETGAAASLLAISWAYASGHKGYLPASNLLCLLASDEGERAAAVLSFGQYQA